MPALVTDPLRYWSATTPETKAVVFDGGASVTYRELDQWSDNVAAELRDRQVGVGDRVGILGANSLEWCAAALGALKIGAIVAPYNPRFVGGEVAYLIEDSAPAVIVSDDGYAGVLNEAGANGIPRMGTLEIARLRGGPQRPAVRHEGDDDDTVIIVYTSGTTANPKGVMFTHRTIAAFVHEWSLMEPSLSRGLKMLLVVSMAGCPGIVWAFLHTLAHGGTLYLERGFDATTALRRLTEERITFFWGVPLPFERIALLSSFDDADLSALESAAAGGARVAVPTLEKWMAKGVALRQLYGMTELSGTSTANSRDAALTHPESFGRGAMFTEHRIVRPDGTPCDPNERGEIILRGPAMTPGYWNKPEATQAAIRDGWFHSGDIGVIDGEGYFRIVDRMKDLIISGGYNIAPSEIEEALASHPDVVEVAVISIDDERFGEVPAAVVTTRAEISSEDLQRHCEVHLARYKVPRVIHLQEVPLPRMPSGKINKRSLKDVYGTKPQENV